MPEKVFGSLTPGCQHHSCQLESTAVVAGNVCWVYGARLNQVHVVEENAGLACLEQTRLLIAKGRGLECLGQV